MRRFPPSATDLVATMQDESSLAGHVGERAVRGAEDDASFSGEAHPSTFAGETTDEAAQEPGAGEASVPASEVFHHVQGNRD